MTKLSLVELQLDERERALVEHLERGPEWTTPLVINTRTSRLREWLTVYREYRPYHGRRYSAFIAFQVAFLRTPF
jgi:hypothetical protein